MSHRRAGFLWGSVLVIIFGSALDALALPSWARKYRTSCSTCHAAFPKLNYFGKAFRNNGYRFPGGTDADATKDPPVSLGADGYKKLFPHSLWPADLPGAPPLAVRVVSRASTYQGAQTTTFEFPHEFELLAGGTIGETFSFVGELEIENENNENEVAMDAALQYDPRPWLHIRVGSIPVHPIEDHLALTAAHYSAYDTRTTPSSLRVSVPNPNRSTATLSVTATTEEDRWRFRDGQAGVSVWGAHNGRNGKGGFTWAGGVANGQGLIDANDSKDVFGRVAYKFGGYGELGAGEMPQDIEFWRDDSFKVGVFGYSGKSTNTYTGSIQALTGTAGAGIVTVPGEATIVNKFNIVGGEFDWWFRNLNVFGLYLRQKDTDPRGTGESIDTNAWFVEGDYVFYPWLTGVMRYGVTKQDFSVRADPADQKFLVPAVVCMARANVKFTLEGQIRLDDAGKGRNRYLVGIDFAF